MMGAQKRLREEFLRVACMMRRGRDNLARCYQQNMHTHPSERDSISCF